MSDLALFRLILLITLASVFPISAALYLAFQREHELRELRKDFKLLGLDSSASLVEHYSQRHSWLEFALHSLLPAVLTGLGVVLLVAAIGQETIGDFNLGVVDALGYGFIGAYIFCIQLIYRRYTTFDLQPSVYMNCTLTLIAGLAFNFTAFTAVSSVIGEQGLDGLFAIVAFSLGYFPLLAIRWFDRLTNAALGNKGPRIDSLPLSVIDGISQFHETRLRDEGVDNVQNLASVKIDQLLASTRFNAQQVVEWIDQAILHSYIEPGNIESFRRCGVRKVSDFLDLWAPYYVAPVEDGDGLVGRIGQRRMPKMDERLAEARRNRALQLQSTPEYLDALYMAARTGPNIAYIETYWKNLKESAQERAAMAVDEARKEVQSIVTKTQLQLFREIGKCDLYDDARETLGAIATTVTEDPADVAAAGDRFDERPEAMAGAAWWLWWLSRDDDEVDYTEAAGRLYERALDERPDDADLLYELSAFFAATGAYDEARDAGMEAAPLFREAGQTRRALLAQTMAAMVCMKAGEQEDGRGLIADVTETLEQAEEELAPGNGVLVRTVTNVGTTLFGAEDEMPEELVTLQSRMKSLLAAGSGGEQAAGGA